LNALSSKESEREQRLDSNANSDVIMPKSRFNRINELHELNEINELNNINFMNNELSSHAHTPITPTNNDVNPTIAAKFNQPTATRYEAKFKLRSEPKNLPYQRLPPAQHHALSEWAASMLRNGRLKQCQRHELKHIVPHFPVRDGSEKSGWTRIVGNFQELNKVMIKHEGEKIDALALAKAVAKFKYVGMIDLSKGFFNVPLAKENQQYCGLQIGNKFYKYLVLPMGPSIGPAQFQEWSTTVALEGVKESDHSHVFVFQDNILVASNSLVHADRLYLQECKAFEKKGCQINWIKSFKPHAGAKDVLGFTIMKNEVTYKEATIKKAILKLQSFLTKKAATKRQRAQVLGQCNYIARTLPSLLPILQPCYQYMTSIPSWSDEATISSMEQQAYQAVEQAFKATMQNKRIDLESNQVIYSDASDSRAGLWIDGKVYSSRLLQCHDSSTMNELQAVKDSLSKIKFKSHPEWNLDNEAAVSLLKGEVLPRKPYVKQLLKEIWHNSPFIKWKFKKGSLNKADNASRPQHDNKRNYREALYKNYRQQLKQGINSRL